MMKTFTYVYLSVIITITNESLADVNDSKVNCNIDETLKEKTAMAERVQFGDSYLEILTELYKYWNVSLENVSVISDTHGRDIIEAMLPGLQLSSSVLHKEILLEADVEHVLTDLVYEADNNHFILIISNTHFFKIIRKAKEMNMHYTYYIWILIQVSNDTLPGSICTVARNMNVYVISRLLPVERDEVMYSSSVLECNNDTRVFKEPMKWTSRNGTQIQGDFSRIPSRGKFLRIVALHEEPYLYKNDGKYTGYKIDILNYISRTVGFEYVVLDCSNDLYGYLDETTQQWSGCVSDLYYGRADLSAAPLHLLTKREKVIDYILPWSGHSGIIILAEQRGRGLFFFMDVFTVHLWIVGLLTIVLSSILVFIFGKVVKRFRDKGKEEEDLRHLDHGIGEAIWFFVSSTAFEGSRRTPHSSSVRILIAGFWMFSNIFMSVFVGNMAALLMTSRLKGDISSVSDLLDQHTVRCSVLRDSSISAHIQDMKSIEQYFGNLWTQSNLHNEYMPLQNVIWNYPLQCKYAHLWERIVGYGFMNTTAEAVKEIHSSNGNFVFITDSAAAEFLAGRYCNLRTIGKKFSARPYGFGIRKNSRLKNAFSKAFLELQHTSTMHEIQTKWWGRRKDCPSEGIDKGLQLPEMSGTFYVILVGVGTGFAGLCIERFYVKVKNSYLDE